MNMTFSSYHSNMYSWKISIVLIFILFIAFPTSILAEILSVKGDGINLRSGPSTAYSVKWEYGNGFPVEVIDEKGDWVKVKDFEEDTGWIHKKLLSQTSYVIVKANRNTDQKVNIRIAPGSDNEIIAKAFYGVVFKKLQYKSGWVKVRHESGVTGWISSNLLWGH